MRWKGLNRLHKIHSRRKTQAALRVYLFQALLYQVLRYSIIEMVPLVLLIKTWDIWSRGRSEGVTVHSRWMTWRMKIKGLYGLLITMKTLARFITIIEKLMIASGKDRKTLTDMKLWLAKMQNDMVTRVLEKITKGPLELLLLKPQCLSQLMINSLQTKE